MSAGGWSELPFVTPGERDTPTCWWDVDPPDDYEAAIEQGQDFANQLLIYFASPEGKGFPFTLSHIVLAIAEKHKAANDGHRGLLVGFFSLLNSALT